MSATILYLNTDPDAHIPQMTLAGMRRYAASRGWAAEAFSAAESRKSRLAALFRKHAPVVGCVWECTDDGLPGSPSALDGVPVVYLHASRAVPENGVRLSTDNEAVAVAAFRELAFSRPAAYAVVGMDPAFEFSRVRARRFEEEAARSKTPCAAFRPVPGERAAARAARLASWIASLPRRTAVFAVNDLVASAVAAAAGKAGRPIPRELILLGVDNHVALCESASPTISSIQIDFERAGFAAAKTIARRLRSGSGGAAAPAPSILPLMTVRRESTLGAGSKLNLVLKAVERIRREACDGLTAADLARSVPCSRWLFEMRFRDALGHSILEEIQHVRLEKVCSLLSDTNIAIGDIAGMCGYRSDIALKWIFRKRMGVSMKEWRSRNRLV